MPENLLAAFVEKGAAGLGIGLEETRRRLAGQLAETHLAALELHLGPGQALQIETQLA
jgi:hypothetical protein